MVDKVDQWRVELRNPDVSVRREAAEQFAASPEASRIGCLTLIEALDDSDDEVRQWVSEALETMGSPDPIIVPALIKRLEETDGDRSYWAATLIGRLGSEASQATSALADALQDHPSLSTCERAAWALGRIGPGAKSAVPNLRSAVKNGAPRLAKLAETAIACIGEE